MAIETFRTLNSTYEVDTDQHLIRRTRGVNPPRSNQGDDGEWQTYQQILPVDPGGAYLIVFSLGRATYTSRVFSGWKPGA